MTTAAGLSAAPDTEVAIDLRQDLGCVLGPFDRRAIRIWPAGASNRFKGPTGRIDTRTNATVTYGGATMIGKFASVT